MKVNEFIQKVNENKTKLYNKADKNALSNFIKQTLNVKSYVPIIDKHHLANRVLDACTFEENGVIKTDSFQKYFLFTIGALKMYTDLEFDEEGNIYEEYDELCSNGLLDAILDTFEEDYGRANAILNMLYADMIENNNSIANLIGTTMSKLSTGADGLIHSLSEKIADINTNINNEDITKLQSFLK